MSWTPQRLDQLGYLSRGRSRHRPRDAAHLYDGPYPFIQTGDVKRAGLYITDFQQSYSEAGLEQSKLWPVGTLCITIAANIAETAILGIDACFPDSIIGFIPDEKKADARACRHEFTYIASNAKLPFEGLKMGGQHMSQDALHRHDISDHAWALLEPNLPGRKGSWGGVARSNRRFIDAILWILRTGAPWRDLPTEYGDWKNTHRRFCRWRDKGTWENLLNQLIDEPDFEWLMIDASHAKVHPHGTGARGGNQAMGRTKGGSTPRYIWPWMRMVCRSELLLQKVPERIVKKLSG